MGKSCTSACRRFCQAVCSFFCNFCAWLISLLCCCCCCCRCRRCHRKCICCDSCKRCLLCKQCGHYDSCSEYQNENKPLNREKSRDDTYLRKKTNDENSETNEDKSEDNKRTLTEVRVLIPLKSEAIDTFLKVFEKQLRDDHGLKAIDTNVDVFNNDGKSNDIVIVICHNHTRVIANVTNAVSKLKREHYRRMFLVILHIKSPKELPNESSKDALTQEDNMFKDFYEIVDVAFSKSYGNIYDCKINTKAFEAIDIEWRK